MRRERRFDDFPKCLIYTVVIAVICYTMQKRPSSPASGSLQRKHVVVNALSIDNSVNHRILCFGDSLKAGTAPGPGARRESGTTSRRNIAKR
jgi:hypothetical protein